MVVIVGGILRQRGILDITLGFLHRRVCEEQVHEGKQFALLLARLFVADVLPHLGQIDVGAVLNDSVSHCLRLTVFDAEHVPFFVCGRNISYRHPCFGTFRFGEGKGGKSSAVYILDTSIIQRVDIGLDISIITLSL